MSGEFATSDGAVIMRCGAIDNLCGTSESPPRAAVSPGAIGGMIVLVTQDGTL